MVCCCALHIQDFLPGVYRFYMITSWISSIMYWNWKKIAFSIFVMQCLQPVVLYNCGSVFNSWLYDSYFSIVSFHVIWYLVLIIMILCSCFSYLLYLHLPLFVFLFCYVGNLLRDHKNHVWLGKFSSQCFLYVKHTTHFWKQRPYLFLCCSALPHFILYNLLQS